MYKFRVSNIIRQPNQNISIQFEDLSNSYPAYKAGQFLTLCFQFENREVRRSYSFSSSPSLEEPYEVTVKRVDNGEISRLLHHKLVVGDVIDVLEPLGLFTYDVEIDSSRRVFLFAAGVGITPLYSILKTALAEETNSKIILVYSNSSKEQTVFFDELVALQAKYPNRLHVEFIWSNSKNLAKARLNRDYLLSLVHELGRDITEQDLFYTCGPLFYMDLVRYTLLGMGVIEENIRKETFYFPEEEEDDDEKEEDEVDTTSYSITLKMYGKEYILEIPYNQTILDVGLANKINLPYSCKSGMCSTCISQVVQGSVKMDYNEVLTDREVENGRCLICTAHPIEDGTVIEVI